MENWVQVAIRIRPSDEDAIALNDNKKTLTIRNQYAYTFDHVFDKTVNTFTIYQDLACNMIEQSMNGINATIFAYGQTSSGKTYTMQGNENEPGIIHLAIRHVFKYISETPDREFLLRASYLEIYNEMIRDLLDPSKENLKIHEHLQKGIFINDLTELMVVSESEAEELVLKGEKNRHFGETNINERSSRSHTIFKMVIESRERDPEGKDRSSYSGAVKVSCINLVDLAGSERVGHTGAEGMRLKEGGHINKSLLALGSVIAKLSDGGDHGHIPYRDSKLTRILQPSLGGNSNTAIICTINPDPLYCEESLSTLKFASRAKKIQNKPEVNETLSDEALLKKYRLEINSLRRQLEHLKDANRPDKEILDSAIHSKKLLSEKLEHLKKFILSSATLDQPKKISRRQTWFPGKMLERTSFMDESPKPISEVVAKNESCSDGDLLTIDNTTLAPFMQAFNKLLDDCHFYEAERRSLLADNQQRHNAENKCCERVRCEMTKEMNQTNLNLITLSSIFGVGANQLVEEAFSLKEHIVFLMKENDDLKLKIQSIESLNEESSKNSFHENIVNIAEKLALNVSLSNELEQLKQQFNNIVAKNIELETKLTISQQKIESYESKKSFELVEKDQARIEFEELRKQCIELNEHLQSKQEHYEKLESDINDLKKKLQEQAQMSSAEIKDLMTTSANLEHEKQILCNNLKAVTESNANDKKKMFLHQRAIKAIGNDLVQLRSDHIKIQQDLRKICEEYSSNFLIVRELLQEEVEKKMENEQATLKMLNLELEEKVESLQNSLKCLMEEKERLQLQLETEETLKTEIERLQNSVEKLMEERGQLQSQLETQEILNINMEMESLQTSLKNSIEENGELQSQLAKEREIRRQTELELKFSMEKLDSYQMDQKCANKDAVFKLQDELERSKKDLYRLRLVSAEHRHEKETLRKSWSELQQKYKDLQQAYYMSKNEAIEDTSIIHMKKEVLELKKAVSNKMKTIERLKQEKSLQMDPAWEHNLSLLLQKVSQALGSSLVDPVPPNEFLPVIQELNDRLDMFFVESASQNPLLELSALKKEKANWTLYKKLGESEIERLKKNSHKKMLTNKENLSPKKSISGEPECKQM